MRGWIEKRYGSSYTLVVDMGRDPGSGRRKRMARSVRTSDQGVAEAELRRWMTELDDGTYVEPAKMTVADWLRRWLDENCRPSRTPKTVAVYHCLIEKQIIPRIGALRLSELRPLHLQRLYTQLLTEGRVDDRVEDAPPGLSRSSVRQIHAILHRALRVAYRLQLIRSNPAEAVEPPRPSRAEPPILTQEQRERFLAAAAGTPYYIPALLAIRLGLRRGEVLALQWSDVDLEGGHVTVRRALNYATDYGIYFSEPKRGSRRRLPLPEDVATALEAHAHEQKKRRLKAGPAWQDHDLVCDAGRGQPWFPESLSSWCREFSESIGLPRLRFHDLRHNYAADMIAQGVHPKVIQARMGHSSIVVTMDTYGHLMPGPESPNAHSPSTTPRQR